MRAYCTHLEHYYSAQWPEYHRFPISFNICHYKDLLNLYVKTFGDSLKYFKIIKLKRGKLLILNIFLWFLYLCNLQHAYIE